MWDALVPLVVRNLAAPWDEKVHCVDAFEWGLGVCEATFDRTIASKACRRGERWRCRDKPFINSRAAALQQLVPHTSFTSNTKICNQSTSQSKHDEFDQLVDSLDGLVECKLPHHVNDSVAVQAADQFAELDPVFYKASWKLAVRHRWMKKENMPVLEHRAGLSAVKHALRM